MTESSNVTTNSFTYIPNNKFNGTDFIRIKVRDTTELESNSVTVYFNVSTSNVPEQQIIPITISGEQVRESIIVVLDNSLTYSFSETEIITTQNILNGTHTLIISINMLLLKPNTDISMEMYYSILLQVQLEMKLHQCKQINYS